MQSLSCAMTARRSRRSPARANSDQAQTEKCTRRRARSFAAMPEASKPIGNSNYRDTGEPLLSEVRNTERFFANLSGTAKNLERNRCMNLLLRSWSSLVIAVALASCAQPQKRTAVVKAAPSGTSFSEVGKVGFYAGQPCASQIMFLFHAGRSAAIPMAAPMRETKILSDAAHRNRSVQISGRWRRSKATGCAYVEVTQVEVQKSFWQKVSL